MRAALWPDDGLEEHAGEIERFFTAPDRTNHPTLQVVFVCPREAGGLCGFVEASMRSYAEGCTTDQVGYIEGWYVDPGQRNQGVGRLLVAAAEEWARRQGCREMASDTELANVASQQAHEQLGYTEVERSIHYIKALE
jgi:aminoglycoside 6'-N-acetyltransferase I